MTRLDRVMHKGTCDIYTEEEIKKAFSVNEQEDDFMPIPDNELPKVKKMNRHERRKWLSQQRKKKTNDHP